MDSKPNQTAEKSYLHAMRNGVDGQTATRAKTEIWTFVAERMAAANSADGTFTGENLDALGDLIHTVQDFTSPVHTDKSGNPIAWQGTPPQGPADVAIRHRVGEMSPSNDWSRFGDAIRITMAAFVQANPLAAGKMGLSRENYEREANRRISDYVRQFFYFNGIRDPIREDAARQCALGNPAACR
jgi:hypothetical protein